jgi:hypothetical protein
VYPDMSRSLKEKLRLRGFHYIWALEKQHTYKPMTHIDVLDTWVGYTAKKNVQT